MLLMTHTSIVPPPPTALAGTMTATDTTIIDMVALEMAEAGEMDGVGFAMATGAVLGARPRWLVR